MVSITKRCVSVWFRVIGTDPQREKFIIVRVFLYTIGLKAHIYHYQSLLLLNCMFYLSHNWKLNYCKYLIIAIQQLPDEQRRKKVQFFNKEIKLHLSPCLVI